MDFLNQIFIKHLYEHYGIKIKKLEAIRQKQKIDPSYKKTSDETRQILIHTLGEIAFVRSKNMSFMKWRKDEKIQEMYSVIVGKRQGKTCNKYSKQKLESISNNRNQNVRLLDRIRKYLPADYNLRVLITDEWLLTHRICFSYLYYLLSCLHREEVGSIVTRPIHMKPDFLSTITKYATPSRITFWLKITLPQCDESREIILKNTMNLFRFTFKLTDFLLIKE